MSNLRLKVEIDTTAINGAIDSCNKLLADVSAVCSKIVDNPELMESLAKASNTFKENMMQALTAGKGTGCRIVRKDD